MRGLRAAQRCLAEERKGVVYSRLNHTLSADVTQTLTGFASIGRISKVKLIGRRANTRLPPDTLITLTLTKAEAD